MTATLHEDQFKFLIISQSVFRMKNVSDRNLERKSAHTPYVQ